ncbi:MAG: DUF4111 domain-containing protein [Chloroflexi bacterium]|nr:DUF4111 domain-containing protein [Chloroflexota bacterium]
MDTTPYADVNAVVYHFQGRIEAILGPHFRGMYLYGSLALGDFDPKTSDIDFIVVTNGDIADDHFLALSEMHKTFEESGSLWSRKIEAAYIPQEALEDSAPSEAKYPQIEKGTSLFREHLEPGWAMQRYVLREHGIVIAGPNPATLMRPVDPADIRRAIATITRTWLEQAHHDPSWLDWLRDRDAQTFVVLTLCRSLYMLEFGTVASKPAAARWAQQILDQRWSAFIERSVASGKGEAPQTDIDDTVAFIQYVVEHSR